MSTSNATRKQLLSVINRLNRRVTIPDVVAETGLSLDTVATALNELAYELQANLDVTERGIIYYKFPDNLEFRLYSSNLMRILSRVWVIVSPILGFIFRISFGLLLLCSIAIVYAIMFLLQVIIAGVSGHPGTVWESFKDLYYTATNLRLVKRSAFPFLAKKGEEQAPEAPRDRGFLLNCYYFLFGPGDPNRDFEGEQSRLIARLIKANKGLVAPEQMAPYTGSNPDEPEHFFGILSKFNGMPVATPSGQLVYLFPDFQTRLIEMQDEERSDTEEDAELSAEQPAEDLPPRLEKKKWIFAGIGKEAIVQTLILGLINFFGTLFFWWMLFAVRTSDSKTEHMFLMLAIYASFFLLFPACRWIYVQLKNLGVKKYNQHIDSLEQKLINETHEPELKLKLQEADTMRQEESIKLVDKLVYTTSRDNLDQEAEAFIEAQRSKNQGFPEDLIQLQDQALPVKETGQIE